MEENKEEITNIQQNSQNKTVLIAEKSGLLGKVISIALKHAGFEVEIVKDGYEVLHKVMNKNICCLILDRYLPSIEGYKLAAIIRDGMNLSSLPIIIISAFLFPSPNTVFVANFLISKYPSKFSTACFSSSISFALSAN